MLLKRIITFIARIVLLIVHVMLGVIFRVQKLLGTITNIWVLRKCEELIL